MNVQHVTDFRSNRSDHIVNAAKYLKKSKLKQEVFKAVYFHKSKIKTVSDIQKKTGLNRIQILQNAKLLVHEQLIHQKPDKINETKPDYVLITPWNLREEIMGQISYIRDWGGKFVIPIPEVKIHT